ncbi:MAG: archaellin/type IV pilin N-terminal domain-containing protein [Candidatus Thermoplasmatota archaeon]|nr:archaellin/type IV pilin N-terminal domain-containing protein [Candidatus Thermoplasmatota archaeon]MEE3083407.1 archaellin/type IV pilin N-terminal domain-containing protein [Candidatus Thermoplasmatota archaeon]
MSSTNGLQQAHLWGGGDPAVAGGLPGFACVYPAGTNPCDPNDCGGPSKVIDAGAYSTITSIGNGVLNNGVLGDATNNYAPGNYSKLSIHADAVIHEGNLLDLTVNHCPTGPTSCAAATDVGLYMRSLTTGTFADGSVGYIPAGRAEYVSPAWRVNAGHTVAIDGNFLDWEGTNLLNMADDMQPGIVAINASTLAQMRVTWDSSFMYIALIGPTFSLTDGMAYLDTGPGGSSTGDSWHVTHTLGFEADYMLWLEDLNNWGIRKVMPTGAWVDITNTCSGIDSYLFGGNPLLQTPVSEFRLPWDCIGSPTQEVRWTALVQWDGVPGFGHAGEVSGVFPEQPYAVADPVTGAVTGQNFPIFGTLNLQGDDLADGTLDDHLVLFRSYTGSGTPGAPHIYQVNVKTRNAEGDYWDWADYAPLVMTTNQDITIDIQRAKPIIENLVDVSYDEDSGGHTITLVDKASDIQSAASTLNWFVTDHPGNTHSYPTPYTYEMQGTAGLGGGTQGASLDINTLENQFGGHRLVLTVMDEHGLQAQQSIEIGIWNVNDKPVICNGDRFDCMPVLYDGGGGNTNVRDENFNGLVTQQLGDASNASGSYIVDMANEQTQSDWNNEAIPQTYTWTADEGTCVPFTTDVNQNVITIAENTANEAGGNCDIVLSLDDGASTNSAADDVTVNFIVNPVNDAPVIKEFDAATNVYVETANGSLQLDWFWDVVEDDENPANLTFDLHRLMHDNDHYDRNDGSGFDELTWSVEPTSQCDYDHYFTITVDNVADTLALDLIPDAATNAPTSEIDFLQDADGDGISDNGIHQIQPASGVYCTVYLWLNDTASAPTHIDYAQHSSGTYTQRSVRETINIQVRNTPEARPDYHFDEVKGYNWLNIDAVLPGTRVPIEIDLTNDGDDPALYNYAHDVQVRFYADDNPTLIQDQVTLSWSEGEVPGVGETTTIRGYVTLTQPTSSIRTFVEVRTINPLTGDYINDVQRRPALEELNWDNNNLTTDDTNDPLPKIVGLQGAVNSVTGFAPGLLAVGLVGAFVGALLMQSRREEDAEEFEALASDEEAVSPVIATILLVAITVVLSGVIYVWAQSLASDTTGKSATPRMSFDQEAKFESNLESNWYWKINVLDGEELASQAILIKVQWLNASGVDTSYQTNLANSSGVYGFVPSNSPNLVTYKDSIDCSTQATCFAGFGANDFIQIRMTDPFDGNAPIEDAVVTMYYAPAGGNSYTMMTWAASFNPPTISPQF